MTPTRSTACRAPRRKPRSRNSWPTASCRPTLRRQAGIFRRAARRRRTIRKAPAFPGATTPNIPVMAALGVVEMGAIVTRGWYRVAAGQCLRPDLRGDPHRLYSYAEAVDANGRTIMRGDAPLAWGGNVALCTRDGKFELSRPQGLRGARLEFGRLCGHRCRRQAVDRRAFQGTVTQCRSRPGPTPRGFRQRRNLGVRSRQHALSASSDLWQQVDDRIRAYVAGIPESVEGRGVPRAEGLLQALRHHHARADDRARARIRTTISNSCTRSTTRRSSPIRRSAPRWRNCPAASSSSPTARASMPTR